MAPIPDLMENGALPVGLHDCTEAELRAKFVYNERRKAIVEGLAKTLAELPAKQSIKHVLVDGSFVEAKVEPSDVDAVIVVDKLGDGTGGSKVLEWVNDRKKSLKGERRCHLFVADPPMGDEWAKFFGTRCDTTPKGLLRLKVN